MAEIAFVQAGKAHWEKNMPLSTIWDNFLLLAGFIAGWLLACGPMPDQR